jgi:hypothetical protein
VLFRSIWEEVLKTKEISVNDNFFRLGGNSILAIKMSNYLNTILKIDLITIRDVFIHSSVENLASHIKMKQTYKVLEQGNI